MSNKSPTPRKSLIETGSILENVIERDREKNGRAAPSQPGANHNGREESNPREGSDAPAVRVATADTPQEEAEPSMSNDLLTDLSTQVSKGLSKAASKRVSKSLLASSSTHSMPQVSQQRSTQGLPVQTSAGAGQSARRRLLDHAEKEAVTRLSIDVPQSMYGRIKQYVAVHNVESIRALTLALYADFLEEEGF